jgi:hypothetical protein
MSVATLFTTPPAQLSFLEVGIDGSGVFVAASAVPSASSALITALPAVVPTAGSVVVFDGLSAVECAGSTSLSVVGALCAYNGFEVQNSQSGVTGSRPSTTTIGLQYFDTTLGYPVWFNGGAGWVNASGVSV